MKLTPEQRQELDRQRAEGRTRYSLALTPEQEREYRSAVAEEEASREANVEHCRRLAAAEAEPGFSGMLRRAIRDSRRSPQELAVRAQIDVFQLEAFRVGQAPLPSDVIDRLVETLRLKLIAQSLENVS